MKQKIVTITQYNKIMDRIIKLNKKLAIDEAFIKLIEESGKYQIKKGTK